MSMRMSYLLTLVLAGALSSAAAQPAAAPEQVARGEYLARIGNCAGCHTAPGGADFAGGRAIDSLFGTFYAPNITADADTGIGRWSADDFWQAMHNGKRADGSAMYPACPYPNYTHVHREDIDAIYAYLRSLPPVQQQNRAHELSFPASARPLVSLWQWLFFKPGSFQDDPSQTPAWNRGAYLVQGLGHCSACHAERNAFGVSRGDGSAPGARIRNWYAPSLYSSAEAGLQAWPVEKGAALLRHGKAEEASAMGPMADVVFQSLQYLTEADAMAMATYLHALPDHDTEPAVRLLPVRQADLPAVMQRGQKIYEEHCQDCHGRDGEGSLAAPALAGNRAVVLADPTNLLNVIRDGGYPPSTGGNPRPYGMPPFGFLNDVELAALATYIRTSWGNAGTPVSSANVTRKD